MAKKKLIECAVVKTMIEGLELKKLPADLKKALRKVGGGYDEFENVILGKISVEEYIEIIEGMGMSEPKGLSEMKQCQLYNDAAWETLAFLQTTNLSKEKLDEIESANLDLYVVKD